MKKKLKGTVEHMENNSEHPEKVQLEKTKTEKNPKNIRMMELKRMILLK